MKNILLILFISSWFYHCTNSEDILNKQKTTLNSQFSEYDQKSNSSYNKKDSSAAAAIGGTILAIKGAGMLLGLVGKISHRGSRFILKKTQEYSKKVKRIKKFGFNTIKRLSQLFRKYIINSTEDNYDIIKVNTFRILRQVCYEKKLRLEKTKDNIELYEISEQILTRLCSKFQYTKQKLNINIDEVEFGACLLACFYCYFSYCINSENFNKELAQNIKEELTTNQEVNHLDNTLKSKFLSIATNISREIHKNSSEANGNIYNNIIKKCKEYLNLYENDFLLEKGKDIEWISLYEEGEYDKNI